MLSRWACLLAALSLAVSQPALADTVRAHLSWQRPAGSMCPTAAVLMGDVEALTGQQLFVPEAEAQVLVHGTIDELSTGVQVRVEARTAAGAPLGSRELMAPAGECAALRAPLAVVLSMLLDRGALPDPSPDTLRPLQLGASFGLQSGLLPQLAPGLGLSLSVDATERWRVRLAGSYWLPISAETATGVGARFQALSANLTACPRLSRPQASASVRVCAGGQLAGVSALPRMLDGPGRQTRLLGQALLELVLALPVAAGTGLEAAGGLVLSPSRPEFYYARGDGSQAHVQRPSLWGGIFRITVTIGGT